MTKSNDYVATAGAEKRLAEAFHNWPPLNGIGWDDETIADIVKVLTANAKIEYKPRLKAIMITLPIPQPGDKPEINEPSDTIPDPTFGDPDRTWDNTGALAALDQAHAAATRPGPGLWTGYVPQQVAVPDGYQDSFPDE